MGKIPTNPRLSLAGCRNRNQLEMPNFLFVKCGSIVIILRCGYETLHGRIFTKNQNITLLLRRNTLSNLKDKQWNSQQIIVYLYWCLIKQIKIIVI